MELQKLNFFEFGKELLSALKKLPNNPKPNCTGFYVYHFENGKIDLSLIGKIPTGKEEKYAYFASKKAMESIYRASLLSRSFSQEILEMERYPGGVNIQNVSNSLQKKIWCSIGVSGHESMIDEAIAVLFIVGKIAFSKTANGNQSDFVKNFKNDLPWAIQLIPDNKWIPLLGNLMF